MFGLTFHEQWYVLGKGEGWRVVAYRGDTQQGPYDGAFVYTAEKDTLSTKPELVAQVQCAALNGEWVVVSWLCCSRDNYDDDNDDDDDCGGGGGGGMSNKE